MALVTQNQAALRAAPRDSAPQQAVLWQGDALEVRGQRMDYLKVYDHRRERAGYIKATQVREISLDPAQSAELLSVVRFLRDTPGAEALGIGYAAAYLQAVPAAALTAEPFDALGSMADRLARRASAHQSPVNETIVSAHLEVAAQYGIVMRSFERDGATARRRDGAMQICYDGEMFRRALALPADAAQSARAALGLTRHECVDPNLGPTDRYQLNLWRAQVLDRPPLAGLTEQQRNRLRIRRAGVWSAIAFAQARRGASPHAAAERALEELAAVDKTELSDQDGIDYTDAAVRVGSSRWAAEPVVKRPGRLWVQTVSGASGEICVLLEDARHDIRNPLLRRCTFATVWAASASSNAAGTALALAVQPLETWRELWVFHQSVTGWKVDVLPPGASVVDLGYIELAGWVPGSDRLLTALEIKADGQFRQRFAVLSLDTLAVQKQASRPDLLVLFRRWQDAQWKRDTVAVR